MTQPTPEQEAERIYQEKYDEVFKTFTNNINIKPLVKSLAKQQVEYAMQRKKIMWKGFISSIEFTYERSEAHTYLQEVLKAIEDYKV
jgi:hypothetical protein